MKTVSVLSTGVLLAAATPVLAQQSRWADNGYRDRHERVVVVERERVARPRARTVVVERPVYVDRFRASIPRYMLRHHVKSGITGWAQVNGLRGDTPLERRIEYDLYYIENWSMSFDLKILLLTFVRVFRDASAV